MKDQSNTELMKARAMKRKRLKEDFILELYIDMLVYEAELLHKKDLLLKKIDLAIDQREKSQFMTLAKEYAGLTKQFGT
ncbi:IDEAL domain-containing protein [Cytobacillus gottheilii]|uniref:IDEAL domain-containing protein n=1 Tax=Cytobacillus gottheilii TaxID=859144 RepID=UPI003CF80601